MPLTAQASLYKKCFSLYRSFNDFLESEDGYLSGDFWYSLEEMIREYNEVGQDLPEALRSGNLRRGFIQMQDRIHEYDHSDVPEPTADLLSSIAYVLTTVTEWPNLFRVSCQPKPIADLVLEGADFQTIAKKYNLVNPSTGIGVASMAEEEFRNPGTYIAPGWIHPQEIERMQNREMVEEMMAEACSIPDEPATLPEEGSSQDIERFASLYEDVEPEALIEQARKMGIVVRGNMKRETIISKIYKVTKGQEAEDGGNE